MNATVAAQLGHVADGLGDALGQAFGARRSISTRSVIRSSAISPLDDQARPLDLRMPAHDLGDLRRMDEHAAHLRRLVGAAEPAADALVGAAGRAGPGSTADRSPVPKRISG